MTRPAIPIVLAVGLTAVLACLLIPRGRPTNSGSSDSSSDIEQTPSALFDAGESALRQGDFAIALERFRAVPRNGSALSVRAAFGAGEALRGASRLQEAAEQYEDVLQRAPDNLATRERLAFVYGTTGQDWEASPHQLAIIRAGLADLEMLALVGYGESHLAESTQEYLEGCAQEVPDDPFVRLGLAVHRPVSASFDPVEVLHGVVDDLPGNLAAQAHLGEHLVGHPEAYAAWLAALPPAADHPGIWFVQGLRARRDEQLEVAARCFWECLRRNPQHRRATFQLAQVLARLEHAAAPAFVARADEQRELNGLYLQFAQNPLDEEVVRRIVDLSASTGRHREAVAWAGHAANLFPSASWPAKFGRRLLPGLERSTPRTVDSANLAMLHDLSHYPAPAGAPSPVEARHSVVQQEATIRFERIDGRAGIDHVYFNAADPATKGARMQEQTGGGVAVLDYDRDGRPDLHFTQGAEWPTGAERPRSTPDLVNRLYRNVGDGRAEDVTLAANVGDDGFGQGCAVGDFDGDGFPDLYVANYGRNRLLLNNGDGTFADATGAAGISDELWTTSCAIADLDGDGHPDLFDVNYVTGPGVHERLCRGRACSPKNWDGVPDRLHRSLGDGTVESDDATPDGPAGKGLGLLVEYEGSPPSPQLLVANDQMANQYLRRDSEAGSGAAFEDFAFLSGVACNEDGSVLACMGIAAGDVNGDGRTDLFVTNFKDEENTLYLRDSGDLFVDASRASGLGSTGLAFVGWGTQFLDVDLDGDLDLVVANGHVDDYRDEGGAYAMRPQLLRNDGHGRFTEVPPPSGSYFDHEYHGRGLARLDWDRDGLPDFVVSNVGEPAALLANRTETAGHFVQFRLHAVSTARDALGSVVEVDAGGRTHTAELVAGDGYMASNERLLAFGLGEVDRIDEVRVRWPSGAVTRLEHPESDVTFELVEGRTDAAVWRGGVIGSPAGDVHVVEP